MISFRPITNAYGTARTWLIESLCRFALRILSKWAVHAYDPNMELCYVPKGRMWEKLRLEGYQEREQFCWEAAVCLAKEVNNACRNASPTDKAEEITTL